MAKVRLMVSTCDVIDHVLVELQELQLAPHHDCKNPKMKPVWKRIDAQIRTLEQATKMLNQQTELEDRRAAAFHKAVAEAGSAFSDARAASVRAASSVSGATASFSDFATAVRLARDPDAVQELLEGAE